jgi:hypothetical protein
MLDGIESITFNVRKKIMFKFNNNNQNYFKVFN